MSDFEPQLRSLFQDKKPQSPRDACDAFHGFYGSYVFEKSDLYDGISALPRPFREIVAAHQAWGMISSDGFSNIFEDTDERFDEEVKRGLKLLDAAESIPPYLEARQLVAEQEEHSDYPLSEEDDERLFEAFYDPIEHFDEMIGAYLLNYLK